MKPLRLYLRGFNGIKAGLGKDEIMLDFKGIKGRVVLKGENGSGKSTILQNMHPYLIMPDRVKSYSQRSFSYYDECFLPESVKELLWEFNGSIYKSRIEINPIKRKTKAYLYRVIEDKEEIIKETVDGSVDSYIEVIEKILGSPELYFTSVFRSQDARRFSNYTKSEFEEIFQELLSIKLIEKLIEICHEKVKNINVDINTINSTIETHKQIVNQKDNILKQLNDIKSTKQNYLKEQEETEQKIINLKNELEKLNETIRSNAVITARKKELQNQLIQRQKELHEINVEYEKKRQYYNRSYKELIEKKNLILKYLSEEHNVDNEIKSLSSHLSDHSDINKKLEELNKKSLELQEKLNTISRHKDLIEKTKHELYIKERQRLNRLAELNTLFERARQSQKLLEEVPCTGTEYQKKCKLLRDAVDTSSSIEDLHGQINIYSRRSDEEVTLQNEIENLSRQINCEKDVLSELNECERQRRTLSLELNRILSIEKQLRELYSKKASIEESKKTLHLYDEQINTLKIEATDTLNKLEVKINVLKNEIDEINKEINKCVIDEEIITKYNEIQAKLRYLEEHLKNTNSTLIEIEYKIGKLEEVIRTIYNAENEIIKQEEKLRSLNSELSEWKTVNRILDELIPLEIEDAGPEISEIANTLLETCYGPRFSITIITKVKSKTNKTAEKDVFEILIYDSIKDQKKPLYYLSGGERVWIEEAISRAMCLYGKLSCGRDYKALFSDERDGALDQLNRQKYFSMKQKVLEMGNFEVEYIISHNPEVIDNADYVIDMDSLRK